MRFADARWGLLRASRNIVLHDDHDSAIGCAGKWVVSHHSGNIVRASDSREPVWLNAPINQESYERAGSRGRKLPIGLVFCRRYGYGISVSFHQDLLRRMFFERRRYLIQHCVRVLHQMGLARAKEYF